MKPSFIGQAAPAWEMLQNEAKNLSNQGNYSVGAAGWDILCP